jgi:Leucine-rich repeat (LRR) protein
LRSLSAAGNGLEGSLLPLHVYSKLTNLEELALSLNAISSSIPTEIGLLSNSLVAIDFSNNAITGTLPDELKALSKLQFIDVQFQLQTGGTYR